MGTVLSCHGPGGAELPSAREWSMRRDSESRPPALASCRSTNVLHKSRPTPASGSVAQVITISAAPAPRDSNSKRHKSDRRLKVQEAALSTADETGGSAEVELAPRSFDTERPDWRSFGTVGPVLAVYILVAECGNSRSVLE